MDSNIAVTYVLRHELISMYAQHKAALMRQEMMKVEKNYKKELAKELVDVIPDSSKNQVTNKNTGKVSHLINDLEKKVEGNASEPKESDKKVDVKIDLKELERRLGAVRSKPENIPIELNPNCFIDGFECDVNPSVVLKVYIYI